MVKKKTSLSLKEMLPILGNFAFLTRMSYILAKKVLHSLLK